MIQKMLLQQALTSVEMTKTLQREIQLARNIQMKLLNGQVPQLSNDEVSGISIPARLIGGDYFDFYPLGNGNLRIIIADVMGKGIPAAMLMILTRGAFRSAAGATDGPAETLNAMNNAIYKDLRTLNSFVTVFCADWDPNTGVFTYANAGHNPPISVRGNVETVEPPELKGVMLGGLSGQIYMEERVQLQKGDFVFFYTDGIVEAQNVDGQMFKLERLVSILIEYAHLNAGDLEAIVVDKINEFAQDLVQKDDITMIVLKVNSDIVSAFL